MDSKPSHEFGGKDRFIAFGDELDVAQFQPRKGTERYIARGKISVHRAADAWQNDTFYKRTAADDEIGGDQQQEEDSNEPNEFAQPATAGWGGR